ncbi:MAG: cyclic pyranopterin monophosphate synthase MoaC [Candidatus Bathyarchaeia archaeon]
MSMVDITAKPEIYREATARGQIKLRAETVKLMRDGKVEKGDPLYTAKISGILAAKNTSMLIPLCHPIPLTSVDINVRILEDNTIEVESTVRAFAQTGVEMEALVATTIALLTIWDMVKQYEKDAEGQYPQTFIQNVQVVKKVKCEFE